MFYHLQYIHLFRPFLKYSSSASPLPPHVSPRRICSANAGFISKLMRLYKKLYNLRQICNIAVYMLHSACTIHLLNLPEKTAKRDIIHGVKHLEEIAEDWLCARRTLSIISVLARKWNCELPEEAAVTLKRTDEKYGHLVTADVPSPHALRLPSFTPSPPAFPHSPNQQPNREQNSAVVEQQMAASLGQDMPTTMASGFLSNIESMAPTGFQAPDVSTSNPTNTSTSFAPHNPWVMSGINQPALPRYYQSYAPVQQPGSSGPSVVGSRQRTTNATYMVDGKDWFLKDGVNWQQNFESWGLSPTGVSGSSNNNDAGHGAVAGGDMFMFKGMQDSDLDAGDGWDFDSSMTNLDMIPGLD